MIWNGGFSPKGNGLTLENTDKKWDIKKPEIKEIDKSDLITHKWFDEEDIRQDYVEYAYKLWGIDFVKMIECENGNWNLKAVWDSWKAFWLCQMNTNYHKLPDGYRDTWQVQVEYCYQKWSTGTKFYWPTRKIKGKTCSEYVNDRFIINQ